MENWVLYALLTPFLLAPLMLLAGPGLRAKTGLLALLAPLVSTGFLLALHRVPAEERGTFSLPWMPELGINLSLTPDGLALFFALVVSVVGLLVVGYASSYLDNHAKHHGRFYCYLLLFMGAMLGTVLSSNLLVLFVFWELTGLSSFLLIGFLHEREESRRGARMALLTTGLTGLALLAGVVLLRLAYGTYELPEILARLAPGGAGVLPGREGLLGPAFLCCFLGIAGKSAQFPFHYWLPNAMAAPTPVSAYLHSATMVKLGVFLAARLLPVFSGDPAWLPTLVTIGFGTLLLGSVLALLAQDLKAVLAHSTVAQLGLLVGYYGLHAGGAPVSWDYLHIFNHVFYKAALFMVVGIIDHCTGTRDLRHLGGLARLMPVTGVSAAIGLAAFAGLPLTTGFLSKEMLVKSVLDFQGAGQPGGLAGWALLCVLGASVLKAAIALGLWRRAFCGETPAALRSHFHAPSLWLQLPPLVLALAALLLGTLPSWAQALGDSFAVPGLHAAAGSGGELHLWPGFTRELAVSAAVLLAGAVLHFTLGKSRLSRTRAPALLRLDTPFDPLVNGIMKGARRLNQALGFENSQAHLPIIASVMSATLLAFLLPRAGELATLAAAWAPWPTDFEGVERWIITLLVALAALLVASWKDPLRQVIALSVVGLGVTVTFVMHAAPDLALTQLLVEVATLMLVLLVVLRLRRDGAESSELPRQSAVTRTARIVLAATFGLLLGGGTLLFQALREPGAGPTGGAGDWYLAQSLALAKGANAVNTIVVDFRGWDTLLEIAVLVIAALGCLGLLHRSQLFPRHRKSGAVSSGELYPVPHNLILRFVALGCFIPLNFFALHLFLRGHNAPGGGFIAGLVTALSLLLLVFAIGVHGVRRFLRINPMNLALCGLALAVGTALLPLARGLPLLAHSHLYGPGGFYLGSPFWFDLGVYLTVVGSVLKLLLPLMKSVHALPAFVSEEEGRFAELLSEPIDLPKTADRRDAAKPAPGTPLGKRKETR